MAFNLTPIQIENLGRVFRAIDKKQKGTISLEDIKDYLMNKDEEVLIPQGIEAQMNAVEKVLTSRKAHHEINYNDFVAAVMWRRIQYDEENMHMVFEALDVHRQGFLTPDSIRQVVGLDKNQEEIDRMFKEADVNTDGCIDYSDFVKNWKRHVVDVQYTPMVEKIHQDMEGRGGKGGGGGGETGQGGGVPAVITPAGSSVSTDCSVSNAGAGVRKGGVEGKMSVGGKVPATLPTLQMLGTGVRLVSSLSDASAAQIRASICVARTAAASAAGMEGGPVRAARRKKQAPVGRNTTITTASSKRGKRKREELRTQAA